MTRLPSRVLLLAALVASLVLGCTQAQAPDPSTPGDAAGRPRLPGAPGAGGLRYGFQVDYGNDHKRAFKLTKDAGFHWVKMQVRWADMERERGKTDWSYHDQVIDDARAQGLGVLLSITTAPAWARPPGADRNVDGPPADPNTFATFAGELAKRYKGKVAAYEVWNEQNLSREWGGPGRVNPAEYVALLKAAYGAIKAADRDAIVVVGALTPSGNVSIPAQGGELARDDLEYLREMYAAGMRGSFDAVGVHPSGFNNPPDLDPRDPGVLNRPGGFHGHRSFYFRNFELYHEVMAQQGDADKELWFTEFGWASGQADPEWAYASEVTEQQQAEYLVKAFQIAKERKYVGAMFVWNLNFYGNAFASRAFAVLNPDWSPRPAYRSLTAMPK